MSNITIRPYRPEDRNVVVDVCWSTGYMGESAEGHFNDKKLFGLLFCLYYTDYEPENCFIAVETDTDQPVGYILSSLNSQQQDEVYRVKQVPRVLRRAFLWTLWRYPQSFHTLLHFRKMSQITPRDSDITVLLNEKYPAHLHIDIYADFQRQGVGTQLVQTLEGHLRENEIPGVHLGTSERNLKAVPFYTKLGFEILYESPRGFNMWPNTKKDPKVSEVKSYIFGKKL